MPRPFRAILILTLAIVTALGCKGPARPVAVFDVVARAGRDIAKPQPPPAVVVVTVNGQAISETEVQAAATTLAVPYSEALKLTVQAEVVAQEARRAAFPRAKGERDRFELAQAFLATVYSETTLCGAISPRTVEQFYEHRYQPEWPADVYQGDLVELRCCQRLDQNLCDPPVVAECLARNRDLLTLLLPVAKAWETGDLPPLVELQKTHPGLVVTDFGVIDWPGIPEAKRRPRALFPESVVDALRGAPQGGVVGPLQSAIGYHLLRLTRRRDAIKADSPEFVKAARETLCRDRIEQTRWDYVKQLMESAVVTHP